MPSRTGKQAQATLSRYAPFRNSATAPNNHMQHTALQIKKHAVKPPYYEIFSQNLLLFVQALNILTTF